MGRRILIVAGEPSGDAQAARLAAAIARKRPELRMDGVGGPAMRAAGVDTGIDISELSVMGVAELAGGLRRILRHYRELVRELRSEARPDLIVLVDFPDFNLRLARAAHRAGVKVVYYVSPQVWAWRVGRIAKIQRRVDRMIVLFPFEQDLYRARGIDSYFVGHPLAEDVVATRSTDDTRRRYHIPDGSPLIALLPGSRSATVAYNLPAMLAAARRLKDRARFALALAPGLPHEPVARMVRAAGVDVALVEGDTYNLLAAADAAAVTSGTATVECALLGTPMVVVYRMSGLSHAIARMLVKVPHIAMPNLLLGERVVPELIQADYTADSLVAELERYLESEAHREAVQSRLRTVRETLVRPGAADRAADLVLEMLA